MAQRDWLWIVLGILGLILVWFVCLRAVQPDVTASAPTAPAVSSAAKPEAPTAPQPPAVLPMASVVGEYAAGKLTLAGQVPDDATRARLVAEAKRVHGDANVIDRLSIAPAVGVLGWYSESAVLALLQVRELAEGRAEFDGKRLVLTGEVVSEAVKQSIGETARAQVGASAVVDNRLAVAAAAVQKRKLDELLMGKTIEFETASAQLTPRGRKILDDLVPILQAEQATRIELAGHTDSQGEESANMKLSIERAQATLAYLAERGVARNRMTAKGYGSSRPISDNATPEGRLRNRRIDFHVLEGK